MEDGISSDRTDTVETGSVKINEGVLEESMQKGLSILQLIIY